RLLAALFLYSVQTCSPLLRSPDPAALSPERPGCFFCLCADCVVCSLGRTYSCFNSACEYRFGLPQAQFLVLQKLTLPYRLKPPPTFHAAGEESAGNGRQIPDYE